MEMRERWERQIRSGSTQFRAQREDGVRRISGYFAVFDDVYEVCPGVTESIDPHAFDSVLSDDVRALIDHETRLVLGRTGPHTLRMRVDGKGLWCDIDLNECDTDATNLYARVQRGDVSQCSFGFEILDEEPEYREDGSVHWTIKRVKLYEVSVVTFPAYKDTSVQARKAEYDQMKKRRADAFREKCMRRLKKHGA